MAWHDDKNRSVSEVCSASQIKIVLLGYLTLELQGIAVAKCIDLGIW